MSDKLKPCPFCGGEVEIEWSSNTEYGGHDYQFPSIECKCGIEFSELCNGDCSCCNDLGLRLAKKWNARQPKQDCVDDVYDLLERMLDDDCNNMYRQEGDKLLAKARGEA